MGRVDKQLKKSATKCTYLREIFSNKTESWVLDICVSSFNGLYCHGVPKKPKFGDLNKV